MRVRQVTASAFVCSAFLCITAAWAQTAPRAQPEIVSHEAPATFSTRVNLVSVPVVIRDREGHPVGGLKQEDFQLFDKGRSQVITKFTVETTLGVAPVAAATAAPVREATPAVAPAPSKPVLPDRYVAYFFDDIHMTPSDLLNARQAANRHLDDNLDTNTRAAVFTTSARTTQDFTSDAAKLHAAVNKIQPWTSGKQYDCPHVSFYVADYLLNKAGGGEELTAAFERAVECLHTTDPKIVVPQTMAAAQRALQSGSYETSITMTVLRDLVINMSALPGNRTVVMVSPGLHLAMEHRLNENDVFEKAIREGVVINTLDIRGLYPPPGVDASEFGAASPAKAHAEAKEAMENMDILAELAYGTGGTFYHNDNGLEEGLKQLAARPEYVYVLGFSPDNLKLDGSYHKLNVKLKDGAKLEVEARRGYWAPNHATDPAEEAREDIRDAVFSREEMQDIPLQLHTEFFKQSETKGQLTVETRVDLTRLKFKKAEDRNLDNLTVVTGLFDENGRYVKGIEKTLELHLLDQTLAAARNSRIAVKENFDLAPGRYVVRVVVRDSEGRSMATQNEGVEIP